MKVVSYTSLLYGSDYLGWAIRSVIEHVDQHVILYCPHGSHGSRTDQPCPDTRDELYAIAQAAAGDKLLWIDGDWSQENQQRESIYEYAPDADVILVVDADEIWGDGVAWDARQTFIDWLEQRDMWDDYPQVRCYRLPIVHFWRSFWRAIVHDPAYPTRIIYPKNPPGEYTFIVERVTLEADGIHSQPTHAISHMGYAQRPAVVEYKQYTHGHRGEWRRDVDWYRDRFLANAQHDCHPVGSEYWNPEPVNPLDYMPDWMSQHPYFGMQVIE